MSFRRKGLKPLLFILILAKFSFAQHVIRGKIFDINTHQPVTYVNIFLRSSQIGTVSDFAGRFRLTIPDSTSDQLITFRHINYDEKIVLLSDLQSPVTIYLQPRVIPLPEVEVLAPGEKFEIKKDLPLMVTNIKARQFEIRGFTDAGDFLRSDESIQVQENLSGSKTISLRGGNADDVLILYNGVKLNNQFSNIFDISLLDLEDVRQLQIIKGSNSVLYGSGAFSGVVNIIPQIEQDYLVRFQQRIGSYDSGNWGLQLYGSKDNLHATYRVRRGGAKRNFSGDISGHNFLENKSFHQTATIEYRFGSKKDKIQPNSLHAIAWSSSNEYTDHRSNEKATNKNDIAQILYRGKLGTIDDVAFSAVYHLAEEKQMLNNQTGWLERNLSNRSLQFHAEKSAHFQASDLLLSYQFEQNSLDFSDARFDFPRDQISGEIDKVRRTQHSVASIFKLHAPGGSAFLQAVDFDLSYRLDMAFDRQQQENASNAIMRLVPDQDWNKSTLKFATRFHGFYQKFLLNIFMNIGNNVKLPTLAQLISAEMVKHQEGQSSALLAENNHSVEIGAVLKRDLRDQPTIYGWEISLNYMKNNYSNKLRPYYIVGLPLAFYDNAPDARLAGFETKASVFLFKKKITAEAGISRYGISEKAAFPFKSENKQIANLMVDHAGYSFLLHWFHESEQIGWVRQLDGSFTEVSLTPFSNVDVHLSKMFSWWKLKLFANISLRNLLSDETKLLGLALRDRRYYLTVGVQY